MAEDYYKTLGVNKDASQADIQKAYRDLARKHHPDLNPDDKSAKEKFQRVQAAFDVLNDTSKRELYDRYGSSFDQMGGGGGPHGPGAAGGWGGRTTETSEDFDFSQFFGERFGGGGGGDPNGGFADIFSQFRRARGNEGSARTRTRGKGEDVRSEVQIPLPTAVVGGTVDLQLHRPDGRVETIAVKIPAGIESGKRIRLRGQGEQGAGGGSAGDLLITVNVDEHPHFSRKGKNLYVKVPVTLAEAAVGAKVDVPTPRGTITLRVPPGTSSGTRLRIKGQGIAPAGETAGDLFAEIQVTLPKDMNDEERTWFESFGQRHAEQPRKDLRW